MKNVLIATTIAALAGASMNTLAVESPEKPVTLKQEASVGVGAIIGGILGGPVGFLIGTMGGAVMGEQLNKADNYDVAQAELLETQQDLLGLQTETHALKQQLALSREQQQSLYEQSLAGLEFQVLFHTGDDRVVDSTLSSLDQLANFLQRYPTLSVRLHGYADPRGTEEYNNVLAMHRAINVQQALEERGVDSSRIQRYSYGADQSTAGQGDLDAYALERRVTIEVINEENNVAAIKDLNQF